MLEHLERGLEACIESECRYRWVTGTSMLRLEGNYEGIEEHRSTSRYKMVNYG